MEFEIYERDGRTYQFAKGDPVPPDMTPAKAAPEAKAAPAPANKSRRPARSKAVGADD